MLIYKDGKSCEVGAAELKTFMSSLYTADGVFETARVRSGCPEYLQMHLSRLKEGAKLINADVPEIKYEILLKKLIRENVFESENGRLRIIVFSGKNKESHFCVTLEPYTPPDKKDYCSGVKLLSARHPFCDSVFARIKTTRRAAYNRLTELSREKGFYDCLLTDKYGIITETTTGNIFFIEDGNFSVPPENCDRMKGIMERVVTEKLEKKGIRVHEKEFRSKNINSHTGMFMTNSLVGVLPVRSINRTSLQDVAKMRDVIPLMNGFSPCAFQTV